MLQTKLNYIQGKLLYLCVTVTVINAIANKYVNFKYVRILVVGLFILENLRKHQIAMNEKYK